LGGALVALGGWQAIFLVNLPVAAVGLVLAWRWLPADPTRAAPAAGDRAPPQPAIGRRLEPRSALRLPRAGEIRNSLWRTLLAQRAIAGICCQFGAVNVVFYSVFFGFPLWLEAARAYGPEATGLLVLPVAGVGVLTTPLAARLINRSGARPALVVGSTLLLAGSLLMLVFDDTTPLLVLLVVGAVLGVPNAFNNLGLQAALYQAAPAAQMGSAGGVFQTFRYLGAIGATALVGLVFGASPTSDGLHTLAAVMAVISAGLLASSLWRASRAPAQ
jgi:MFS family permease